MKKALFFLSSLFLSSSLLAQTNVVNGLSYEDSQFNLSRVQKQITLVQSQKGDSDLRVSFVQLDHGGSTDVSPFSAIYLTTFNESEMRGASSAHKIADINSIISHQRIAAGIYSITVKEFVYDMNTSCTYDNGQITATYTIDARHLTAKVRKFADAEDFGHANVTDSINITKSCL